MTDWRDDLVDQRKRLLNQAEGTLNSSRRAALDAIGRTGKTLTRLRRAATVTTADPVARMRLAHVADIATRHDQLSAQIKTVEADLRRLVDATGTTLRDEAGIDWVLAARLLVEVGDPPRFRDETTFARWCGTGAVAVSSGEADGPPTRHRLDLGGNRRVNSVLHIASVVQARDHRRRPHVPHPQATQGKTSKEARRAHKRHLANRVIRRMWNDANQPQRAAA